jgi:phage gpG-like protein
MSDIVSTNAAQAAADLADWAKQFEPQVYRDVGPLADRLVAQAAQVVPVVSGALAASIGARHTAQGLAVVAGVDYGGWVEFGGTRGRPYVAEGRYVYPAVVAHEQELVDALNTEVQTSIDRYPWTKPTGG